MEFFKEKNLWQIFKSSQVIPISKSNKWISIIVASITFINGCFLTSQNLYEVVTVTSGTLFGVLITTLGFLVAGYTIFCTVIPLDLQKNMSSVIDEEVGLSYFNSFHFLFLRVFFYFVIFSGFLFLINFFHGSTGLIFFFIENKCFYFVINLTGYTLISGITIFILMELMSFIFNIFQSVRTTLYWEKSKDENE